MTHGGDGMCACSHSACHVGDCAVTVTAALGRTLPGTTMPCSPPPSLLPSPPHPSPLSHRHHPHPRPHPPPHPTLARAARARTTCPTTAGPWAPWPLRGAPWPSTTSATACPAGRPRRGSCAASSARPSSRVGVAVRARHERGLAWLAAGPVPEGACTPSFCAVHDGAVARKCAAPEHGAIWCVTRVCRSGGRGISGLPVLWRCFLWRMNAERHPLFPWRSSTLWRHPTLPHPA